MKVYYHIPSGIRQIVLILVLSLLLSACGSGASSTETDWTPAEIISAVYASQDALPEMELVLPGDARYSEALTALYRLDGGAVADGAVLASKSVSAVEIAILRLQEDADTAEVRRLLKSYIDRRYADFAGYFPQAEEQLERARVLIRGNWAALLICPDPDAAEAAFSRSFTGAVPANLPALPAAASEPVPASTPVAEPTPAPWSYDHDRIVSAWTGGDWSGLHPMDQLILNRIAALLEEVTVPGQTPAELELAVHDWMIDHIEYDTGHLERYDGTENPNNDNPYGALVDGMAICEGYTNSFQLLMDLVGIECISVFGHSDNGWEYGEHAWNQVRLDGDWYVVDVTWDDPLSSAPVSAKYHHVYFNVTSDAIRRNHFWDETEVPEALGMNAAWYSLMK